MTKSMAQIQNGPESGFFFIGCHDFRLVAAGLLNGVDQLFLAAGKQRVHVFVQPAKKFTVTNQAVFDHFRQARMQFPLRQGRERGNVANHGPGLMKGANHVFPERMIDGSLAPHG